ncbi:MAG: 2-oxoacid:acceptor oxidoreductase family protein [Deltaproteobacteria bacterium]|nr:2-oxoacid:acceptor oxidoreductase family protein [Deltaproteobacteria bacterium]
MDTIREQLARHMTDHALEMRGDGRAGSGLVLTWQAFAAFALSDHALHVQEWPLFSSARKGAPTRSFLRVSRSPIEKASPITHPHLVVAMDIGVTAMVDFAEGVLPNSVVILNTGRTPEEVATQFQVSGHIFTIDGDQLALHYLKKPLGNISVLALLTELVLGWDAKRATPHLIHLLEKRRLPPSLVQRNCELFEASFGESRYVNIAAQTGANPHPAPTFRGYGDVMPGAQSNLRRSRSMHTAVYARTGFRLQFADPQNACNGCGHCIVNCPENIIDFRPDPNVGVAVTGAQVSTYCKLCRECIEVCPKQLFSEAAVSEEEWLHEVPS